MTNFKRLARNLVVAGLLATLGNAFGYDIPDDGWYETCRNLCYFNLRGCSANAEQLANGQECCLEHIVVPQPGHVPRGACVRWSTSPECVRSRTAMDRCESIFSSCIYGCNFPNGSGPAPSTVEESLGTARGGTLFDPR